MKKNPAKETEEEKSEGGRNTTRFGITKSRDLALPSLERRETEDVND